MDTEAGGAAAATRDEIVGRARALAPALRERARAAEELRRLPGENVADLRKAGLLKVLQPRRFGGYQMDVHTHLDVVAEIARGCGSTGWCLGVMHAHSWLAGLLPEAAQEELYGADPDAAISAVIAPRGTATRTDGGYVLNGFWPFGSGCEHSDWLFLGAAVQDEKGETIDEADLLAPTSEIEIKDDWNVVGLRGTGSCSLVAKDVFVPAHRYLSLVAGIEGKYPGAHLHDGWLHRSAFVPVLAIALTGPALGVARAAFDDFRAYLPGRTVAYTAGDVQIELAATHLEVAEAATRIDAAELLLRRSADDIERAARAGEDMPLEIRARVRMDCAYAVRQCLEAVEILYLATGGGGIADRNPIQRAQRDIHAINMHGLLALKTNLEMYGRILLGLPQNTPLI